MSSDLLLAELRGEDRMRGIVRAILDPHNVRRNKSVEALAREVRMERDAAYTTMQAQRVEILALRKELREMRGEAEPVLEEAVPDSTRYT